MNEWNFNNFNNDEDDDIFNSKYNPYDLLERLAYNNKVQEGRIAWLEQTLKNLIQAHNGSIEAMDQVRQENTTIAYQNQLLKNQLNETHKMLTQLHKKVAEYVLEKRIEKETLQKK